MFIRLFRYPVLILSLWSLLPGVAELSFGGVQQESFKKEVSVSGQITIQQVEDLSANGGPCNQNCDDENCPGHHCHFGHCKTLAPSSKLALSPPSIEPFHTKAPQSLKDILVPPLQRPPYFQFPSA